MKRSARSSARRESRAARWSPRSRTRCSPRTRRRRARHATRRSSSTTAATSACSRSSCPRTSRTRLLDEARERALEELERLEEETGEKNHTLLSDDDLEIDWSEVPEDLIDREDVTPDNFGRIAAQTAKQVILQRIREAEREMMYDEYIDRVGEVVTGIVQQTGDRRNILVDLGKVEALLPGPEQVDGERYEQGSRIKAVIREVRTGHEGPAGDPVAPRSRADQDAVRARGAGDRRRARRDPRRRPRAGLPLEDRRRVAHAGCRPGRCLRRPARLARAHGRLRAPRREDRHHPVEPRARPLRRQGAVAGARPRGLPRRRGQGGDGRRPRRPARARDRQGGHERPPRRAPDRAGRSTSPPTPSSRSRRPTQRSAARAGTARTSPAAVPRCSRTASAARTPRCPAPRYCGVPAHQELALHEPNEEDNPIVAESEPELEELADTAEPESVTEDAAEFAGAPPEEFPAGPGDAPCARRGPDTRVRSRTGASTGMSRTIRTTAIPIERAVHEELQ